MIGILVLTVFTVSQRGLWIRAMSIADTTATARIMEIVDRLEVTDVYIQVVVGGYAYYRSGILPRSEVLARAAGNDYQPFDYWLESFHRKNIRVHAWVNACLAWSLEKRPDSTNHVMNQHPDWFLKDIFGRSMVDYSYSDWRSFGLEGLFLDPGLPAVRAWWADICQEIAARYPVDGVHLDFIRYPGLWWDIDPSERSSVLTGQIADTLQWLTLIRYPQVSLALRWMFWNMWKLTANRESNIKEAIYGVRTSIKAVNPACIISFAAVANPALARYRYGQIWWQWQDIVDYPVLMSYTEDVGVFQDMLEFAVGREPDAVMGIGLIWPDMEPEGIWQMKRVEQKGGQGLCFFDFESLDTLVNLSLIIDSADQVFDSLKCDSSRYLPIDNIFPDKPSPAILRKSRDRLADAQEFAGYLLSLSFDPVRDLARMGISRSEFLRQVEADVKAFWYADERIFPLNDTLHEPVKRVIAFELLPWAEADSSKVRKKAQDLDQLTRRSFIYPFSLDRLAKAVFKAKMNERNILETRQGIYVFAVEEIIENKDPVSSLQISPELKPIYQGNTVLVELEELLRP